MHVVSGLFSWSMAAGRRGSWHFQVASAIDQGPLSASHNVSIFPSWASEAGGECRPRSEAPCTVYYFVSTRAAPSSSLLATNVHGLDIGWSATCDRECTIVVHINIVMFCGSSHMHAMQNTKRTWCLSTPYASRRYDTWCKLFHIKPLFQRVFVDFQHTQRPR